MRRIGSAAAIVASLVTVVAVSTARGASSVHPWLAGHGSWSTYSMRDVNREDIGDFNDHFARSGLSMREIHNGFGFGMEAGVELGRVSLGVGAERLLASSTSARKILLAFLDEPVEFGYRVPATAIRALVEYRLPTRGALGARLGVAGGVVSVTGEVSFAAIGTNVQSLDYSGRGPLFEGYGCGEWWVAPQFALSASLGYRLARVNEPSLAGEELRGFSVDYSGVAARAGFRLALGK